MADRSTKARCIPALALCLLCAALRAEDVPAIAVRADRADRSSRADPAGGRSHWAFQPLRSVETPRVRRSDWPRSTIDRLVLARLEANGLRPAADASRRVLVRRVVFLLVGLPPTPTEVAAFLADPRPDALERLVDRLLDSPQFGERWGRHWLDLARYADSNGLDENFLFREAWRFRNWVIDAVNADMRFDRFVIEQIAGDLLPHDSIEQRDRQRIATGFLVVGPKVLLGNNPRNQRMEVADEQIDTIGRALLGQTLGCARCHDHKFDPVPTADYYALAGILASTRVMERRYMLGQQRVMEQLIGLGERGDERDGKYEKYWRERPRLEERARRAKSALELLEKGDATSLESLEKLAKEHDDCVAEAAIDAKQAMEKRLAAQKTLLARLAAAAKPVDIPPRAMIATDADAPSDEAIRIAGQFDRPGDVVPRGFLSVIGETDSAIPDGESGRLELARWLTDVEHGAGRLTARVFANRIWYHLIGDGIVRTVDNFGRTGEAPTHPELLDFLARELIDSGWSLKSLVRRVVLSRTFAMSSRHDDAGQDELGREVDPENRLLWRAHRRRLDPEALRDAMLSVAGELDLAPMESSVWYLGDQATAVGANRVRRRTDFPCRSVYLPVIRNDLPEVFEAFDFADPHTTTGMRPRTTVATQGLFVLNDESVMKAADAIVRRVRSTDAKDDASCVERLFELILNVPGSPEERAEVLEFIRGADSEHAWSMACHALLASSRFQLLE